jgi:hypothetical protein
MDHLSAYAGLMRLLSPCTQDITSATEKFLKRDKRKMRPMVRSPSVL